MEFEEVREYRPGDEVRLIDWNVTARSATPHLKQFREERNLTLFLVVDLSASMRFTHTAKTKGELVAEVAAILAFAALAHQDRVGLVLFTSEIELYLPPRNNKRHLLRVIRELLEFVPRHKGSAPLCVPPFLARVHTKRAVCLLFTDGLSDQTSDCLKRLPPQHEWTLLHFEDLYESQFPLRGTISLQGLEDAERVVIDGGSASMRVAWEQQARQRTNAVRRACQTNKIEYLHATTEQDSATIVHRFFTLKKRELRRRGC